MEAKKHMRDIIRFLFLSIPFTLLFNPLHAQEQTLDKITLQLQWKDQFEFAGFYAAKEKGFYKEAGLEVNFKSFSGNMDTVDEVLEGRAQYGLGYSNIIARYLHGEPLVFVANFFKQSPLVIVAQKEFVLPSDLEGKRVMGVSKDLDSSTLLMMFKKFDMDATHFESVQPTFKIDDFINKKVDAMTVFTTNETYYLDKAGVHYNILNPGAYGAPFYDVNLFTTQEELEKNPQRVEKFREASIKGWQYALAHKEEMIALIQEKYNGQNKSYDALMYEAKQIEYVMLPSLYPIGSIDEQRVLLMAENFVELGLIPKGTKLKFDKFIYGLAAKETIQLNAEEKAYLKNKKEIKLCIQPDLYPLDGFADNTHTGMAGDFYQIIGEKLNVDFSYVVSKSQAELQKIAHNKGCELISVTSSHKKRFEYYALTDPLASVYFNLITTHDKVFHYSKKELEGKLLVTNIDTFKDSIDRYYPNVDVEVIYDTDKAMRMVKNGEAYGFVTLNGISDRYVESYGYDTFKVNGLLAKEHPFDVSIGVIDTDTLLLNILNKTIATIEPATIENIQNRWRISRYHIEKDYALVWQILLISLFVLGGMYYWNKRLKREIKKRHEAEEALRLSHEDLEEKIQEGLADIYSKEKLLNEQSRLAQMGEMIGMIAHQWRQPLGALSATTVGIQNKIELEHFNLDQKEERKEFEVYLKNKLKSMAEYVNVMSETIEVFLNFLKKENKTEKICLNDMVNQALHILQPSLNENQITVEFQREDIPNLTLVQNEVTQVILNILKNAEEALLENDAKTKKISIRTYQSEDTVFIEICDTAGGIPADILPNIFDPYFSTKGSKNGTGLGLYLAKIIVEDHHSGRLAVGNKNNGACFILSFSADKEDQ